MEAEAGIERQQEKIYKSRLTVERNVESVGKGLCLSLCLSCCGVSLADDDDIHTRMYIIIFTHCTAMVNSV